MHDLHGHVEEDGEQELVVDGHGYEPALVELAGSFPDHDAESDAPEEEKKLNWKENNSPIAQNLSRAS